MSSLVEVEPYQLTVAEPHAPVADHTENHRETNLLHLAWRNRWLILLCMIIGAAGAWVTLAARYASLHGLPRGYISTAICRKY